MAEGGHAKSVASKDKQPMEAFQSDLMYTKMALVGEGCDPAGGSKKDDKG